jgi:hypothetical protein
MLIHIYTLKHECQLFLLVDVQLILQESTHEVYDELESMV